MGNINVNDSILMDNIESLMEDVIVTLSNVSDENRKIEYDALRTRNLVMLQALEVFAAMVHTEICKENGKYE